MPKRPPAYRKTATEYALDYDVTPRAVRSYMGKGYPLDDPARMEQIFAGQKNRPKSTGPAVEVDAAKLTNEQLENPANDAEAKLFERILICRKLAHGLSIAKRDVIPKEEVKADMARIAAAMKTRLLALPGEMPGLLVGKVEHEIQKTLFGWVHDALTDFHDAGGKLYA